MFGTTPLSQETDLQYILSDIPFFAVGVFAFGTCTFLLVLKRLNRIIACLHGAIFLAFAGAILDLVQVLARGKQSAAAVANINPFLSLTISREIAYALSFGLRFLFYWALVACPPRKQQDDDREMMHSGSWGRWGITGYSLKYLLILMTLAITTLQVMVRVDMPLENNSFLFNAEGALESSISAVFMLKIFLNIYLAALDSFGATSRSQLLLEYSPVLCALVISLGIGVGNVVQYLFTETILGRFLQSIELYLLVLHTLVMKFRFTPSSQMSKRRNRSSSFHNMPPSATRSSEMLLGPPRLSEPKFNPMFAEDIPFPVVAKAEQMDGPSQSYATMMSTWFTRKPSKRTPPRTPTADPMLTQDQAERGVSPVAESINTQFRQGPQDRSPTEPWQSLEYRDPVYTSIVVPDPNDPVDPVDSLDGTPVEEFLPTKPARVYSRGYDKPALHPGTPPSASGTASPIYGLYGKNSLRRPAVLTTPPEVEEDPRQYFDRSARSSGISMLLRQQEELDRSIAALQIFSQNEDSRSSSAPSLTPNGSHRFSLSNFPEPPWGRASIASTTVLPIQSPNLPARTLSPEQPVVRDSLVPPTPRPRQQSIPLSEVGARDSDLLAPSARPVRTNSMGTQYEITSFIGHLTHPRYMQPGSVSTQGSLLGTRTSGALRMIPEHAPRPSDQTLSILSEKPRISVTIPQRPERDPQQAFNSIRASPSLSSIQSTSTITGRPLNGLKARPMGLPAQPRLNPSPLSSRPERSVSFVPTPF